LSVSRRRLKPPPARAQVSPARPSVAPTSAPDSSYTQRFVALRPIVGIVVNNQYFLLELLLSIVVNSQHFGVCYYCKYPLFLLDFVVDYCCK
jgi:hypothetical protein